MSTEERSKWRIINVADVIRCEQHRLKFPKIHLIKILKFSNYLPVVSGSATNLVIKRHGSATNLVIKIFSQQPHPLLIYSTESVLRTLRTLRTVFICLRRKGVKGGLITDKICTYPPEHLPFLGEFSLLHNKPRARPGLIAR